MFYVSGRSFGSSVPGIEGLVNRKIGLVDITPTGIRVRYCTPARCTTCFHDPEKWLTDMVYFLIHGIPPEELTKAERKRLGVHNRAFSLLNDNLYHKSADGVWRRVVRMDEQEEVLRECHSGVAGGHYVGDVTARKVWQSGLWWPTVLRDAHRFAKECELC
jgi:hypothetical protein